MTAATANTATLATSNDYRAPGSKLTSEQAERLATVRIEYNAVSDWVQVTSLRTGRAIRIDGAIGHVAYSFTRDNVYDFLAALMSGASLRQQSMSYGEMEFFAFLASQNPGEEQVVSATLTDEKKCPDCGGGATGISSHIDRCCGECVAKRLLATTQESTPSPVVVPAIQTQPTPTQPTPTQPARRRRTDPLADVREEALALATAKLQTVGDSYIRIDYDIPDETERTYDIPGLIRRAGGFMSSKSNYAIRSSQMPPRLLGLLYQVSDRLGVWRYHPDETEMVQQDAVRCTDAFAVMLHTSLITSLEKAARKCDEAKNALDGAEATEKAVTAIERVRINHQRAALKLAQTRLEMAIKCAEQFDVTMDLKDCIQGIKDALASRRKAFEASLIK